MTWQFSQASFPLMPMPTHALYHALPTRPLATASPLLLLLLRLHLAERLLRLDNVHLRDARFLRKLDRRAQSSRSRPAG